jgi:hypothetical protein
MTTDNRIKTILSTVVRLAVQVGCRIARPAKAGTNLDSGTFSTSLLLARNLKLRSFRGDGPHFDGLTVVETGTVFSYLHRFFKTVCSNDKKPAIASLDSENGPSTTVFLPVTILP